LEVQRSTFHAQPTDGEETYRLPDWYAYACWQLLQLHAGPQLQTSPHRHEAAGLAAGSWQPHLHSEPVQTAHAQAFD
jgi:hypothetical protein